MLTREEIRHLFENKEVCLVGNSIKLFDNKTTGSLIDSYDTVCRFNKGILKLGDPSYGNRFDVLFYAQLATIPSKHRTDPTEFGDAYLIHTGRKGRHRIFNEDKSHFVSLNDWAKLRDNLRLVKKQDPSTGIVAIDFVLSLNPKKVILFGFDWKKNPTFYNLHRDKEPHNYSSEQLYISKLSKVEIK